MEAVAVRPQVSSWRWWITGLLLLATAISYMDRTALTGVSDRVTSELGLDNKQYGDLELGFGWAFAAGSLAFGYLVNRFGVYLLYPAILVGWSLSGMATGWAHGYAGLLICRTLLGFFEAGHWPCGVKITFAVLAEKERTLGNSIMQSGASIGAILTPQILKLLLTDQAGSWRNAFIIVGATGLFWALGWFLFVKPRDFRDMSSSGPQAGEPGLTAILMTRRFWAVALLIVGAQTVWHIYRVWLLKFLHTGRGYDEVSALNFISYYYIATDVGCLVAGFISLQLVRWRGLSPHASRRVVYAGACCLTSLSLCLPWLSKGWPLLVTLLLIGAGALALFPCYYSFLQELSAPHVGWLTGVLSMWVWAVTSPLHSLFGWLADQSKANPATSYDLGLVVAGLFPWIGVLAMKWLWSKSAPCAVVLAESNPTAPHAD